MIYDQKPLDGSPYKLETFTKLVCAEDMNTAISLAIEKLVNDDGWKIAAVNDISHNLCRIHAYRWELIEVPKVNVDDLRNMVQFYNGKDIEDGKTEVPKHSNIAKYVEKGVLSIKVNQ